MKSQLYTDPVTRERIPLQEALEAGLLGPVDSYKPVLSIREAVNQGLADPNTGNFLDPQTGRVSHHLVVLASLTKTVQCYTKRNWWGDTHTHELPSIFLVKTFLKWPHQTAVYM